MTTEKFQIFCQEALAEFQEEYTGYGQKIINLLEYWFETGEHVCLWGIGKKAIVFISQFDPMNKYIFKLIDMDQEKIGIDRVGGRAIESPKTFDRNDTILLVQDIEISVEDYLLNNISHPAEIKVVSLQEYLNGNWTLDDIKSGKATSRRKYFEDYEDQTPIRTDQILKRRGIDPLFDVSAGQDMISVVLPTFNGERYLRESIESVLNQSISNLELIIVDDCSTDSTLEIAEQYAAKDTRVHVIHNQKNMKLPASLNIGFKAAHGMYFTWTSDDNVFKRNALEMMFNKMQEKHVDIVFANFSRIDEDGYVYHEIVTGPAEDLPLGDTVGACFLYTRPVDEALNGYDENFFCAEDYDFWLRAYYRFKYIHIDENLYFYRMHKSNLTATKRKQIYETTLRVMERQKKLITSDDLRRRYQKRVESLSDAIAKL